MGAAGCTMCPVYDYAAGRLRSLPVISDCSRTICLTHTGRRVRESHARREACVALYSSALPRDHAREGHLELRYADGVNFTRNRVALNPINILVIVFTIHETIC